jgi:hypothetical protein
MHVVVRAGKYGVGSRSYFHYTDIVSVVSGSTYVGLDPLNIVSSSGGFKMGLGDGTFLEGAQNAFIISDHRNMSHWQVAR